MKSKQLVEDLLAMADVRINGDRPWDIQVLDERLYDQIISRGSLGLGEAYMDGWWEVQKLDEFFFKTIRAQLHRKIEFNFVNMKVMLSSKIFNLQTKKGSKELQRSTTT